MNNRSQYFWCVLFVIYHGKGAYTCDLSDIECLTKASNWAIQAIIPGIKGLVEPSDPLYKEEIIGDLPTFKCHLSNVTLSGMTTCVVTQLTLNPKELTYEYFMRCPQLVLNAVGDVKGSLETVQIEGNGKINLVIDDYVIEFKGNYVKYLDKDNKPHFVRKTYTLETDPVGGVTFEAENQTGDKTKSDQQNSKLIEKLFRDPVLDACFDVFVDHLSTFLKTFPIDDILLNGKKS